jgi:hypothetical protein
MISYFEFSLAKAEYLLNFQAEPGQGGDKRRFWRDIMGFQDVARFVTAYPDRRKKQEE